MLPSVALNGALGSRWGNPKAGIPKGIDDNLVLLVEGQNTFSCGNMSYHHPKAVDIAKVMMSARSAK
jgi:hypothetical protein